LTKILSGTIVAVIVGFLHVDGTGGVGLLHAGIRSICVGVAAITLAVVVESVAVYALGHIENGWYPNRLNISIFEARYLDNTAAASPTVMQTFKVVPVRSPEERYLTIEKRFSFDGQSASFEDRFCGTALRLASLGPMVMGLASGQYGAMAVLEQPGSPPPGSSTSVTRGGSSGISSAPRNPGLSARASTNNANRGSEARQASLALSTDNQTRTAIYDISSQTVYLPDGRRLEAH